MKPILSLRDLSSRLGVPMERLRMVANSVKSHYREWPHFDEKKNKVRTLRSPDDNLKEIQRRIKAVILDRVDLSDAAHGGVRGRSPATNVKKHLGQRYVINVDAREFFPSIRHYVVYRMFRHELGFGRDVASLLTRLTTLKSEVPQGAPTSTGIANAILRPIDGPLTAAAHSENVQFTRFVDDITLSGAYPQQMINLAGRLLSARRLQIHRPKKNWPSKAKFKISSRGQAQEVTGLIVNGKLGPSISRKRRDDVRAAVFGLLRAPDEVFPAAVRSVRGRINHVRSFNRGCAERLERQLATVLMRREADRETGR